MAAHPPAAHDVTFHLACAVIRSSVEPIVMLDDDLLVVCASNSFCAAFGVDRATVDGMPVSELGGRVAKLRDYLVEAGRDPQDFGLDVRIEGKYTPRDQWVKQAIEVSEIGATHVALNTMGLGFTRVGGKLPIGTVTPSRSRAISACQASPSPPTYAIS